MRQPLFKYGERQQALFNIAKTYTAGGDAFLSTSRSCKIGKNWQARSDRIVIGLVNQVALTAYAAEGWALCAPGRYEFHEGNLDDEDRNSLVLRSFRKVVEPAASYWGRGGFVIFEINDQGQPFYRRGIKDRPVESTVAE